MTLHVLPFSIDLGDHLYSSVNNAMIHCDSKAAVLNMGSNCTWSRPDLLFLTNVSLHFRKRSIDSS